MTQPGGMDILLATRLERIFEPGMIGNMGLKNRLIMPAMETQLPDMKKDM